MGNSDDRVVDMLNGVEAEQAGRQLPVTPAYDELVKTRREAARRSGPVLTTIPVEIKVVTPILGGGSKLRELDDVEIIRPPTIRGHLRFWWRALHGHEFASSKELYTAESALWGRAANEEGGRSAVDLQIEIRDKGQLDNGVVNATSGAYALWPARGSHSVPDCPRRKPGTRFRLTLVAPKSNESELRDVIRAWLLFGGYGSRTRRGLGSFQVVDDFNVWLPSQPTRASFTSLFDRDIFMPTDRAVSGTPLLAGASLYVGKAVGVAHDAVAAWDTALNWLKTFRQGTGGMAGSRAREPGTAHPSISNWPEADKIRRLTKKTSGHFPRHNSIPAWPRASFGLPIIGKFRAKAHGGEEPGDFELRWRVGTNEYDRLASPLIVKALPLADGTLVPCALWFNRDMPQDAEVGLARQKHNGKKGEKEVDQGSVAPFDRLVAQGDTPQFSAIDGKKNLREAFLDWLSAMPGVVMVAP